MCVCVVCVVQTLASPGEIARHEISPKLPIPVVKKFGEWAERKRRRQREARDDFVRQVDVIIENVREGV